jgi:predicted site-specific integrase-resolvase
MQRRTKLMAMKVQIILSSAAWDALYALALEYTNEGEIEYIDEDERPSRFPMDDVHEALVAMGRATKVVIADKEN